MLLAYQMSAYDNDSFMLGEDQRQPKVPGPYYDWRFYLGDDIHPACCRKCGRKIDPDFVSPSFRVKKRRADCGSTYDGYTIVSARFKSFCESQKVSGAKFVPLPADDKFYWLRPKKILKYDLKRGKPTRANWCPRCKHYHDVHGDENAFVGLTKPIKTGIYRSDIEFASGHEQFPLIVVGTDTAKQFNRMKFTGLHFEAIEA